MRRLAVAILRVRWFGTRLAQSEGLVNLWSRIKDHAKASIDSRAEHEKNVATKCDGMVGRSVGGMNIGCLVISGSVIDKLVSEGGFHDELSKECSGQFSHPKSTIVTAVDQTRDASGLANQEKRVDEQMQAMMADRKEVDARIAALEVGRWAALGDGDFECIRLRSDR